MKKLFFGSLVTDHKPLFRNCQLRWKLLTRPLRRAELQALSNVLYRLGGVTGGARLVLTSARHYQGRLRFLPGKIENRIFHVRGKQVMLDRDLAVLYGVETRALNQAVRRNKERFPEDFLLTLSREEIRNLSQTVISSKFKHAPNVFAFTEQGIAMLSGVLNSKRAVLVNIQIMRAFVGLRREALTYVSLKRKIAALENKYDAQFRAVFSAIKQILIQEEKPKRQIGFHVR